MAGENKGSKGVKPKQSSPGPKPGPRKTERQDEREPASTDAVQPAATDPEGRAGKKPSAAKTKRQQPASAKQPAGKAHNHGREKGQPAAEPHDLLSALAESISESVTAFETLAQELDQAVSPETAELKGTGQEDADAVPLRESVHANEQAEQAPPIAAPPCEPLSVSVQATPAAVIPLAEAEKKESKNTTRFFRFCFNILKKFLYDFFVTGMAGMALGLFATLIMGTIVDQLGNLIGNIPQWLKWSAAIRPFDFVKNIFNSIGTMAKYMTCAGIGVGAACKFKKSPLVVISAAVAGMIGGYSAGLVDFAGGKLDGSFVSAVLVGFGEPLSAYIAAFTAVKMGGLVAGKTKLDIIVTPFVALGCAAVIGLSLGVPISSMIKALGNAIGWATDKQPFLMGIVISVLMGMSLTLPISSAALGLSLGLTGIAAGAATAGCCAQMIGFAVSSFRENKWGGLMAQGVGTSMLQMPNIVRRPVIWVPSILACAVLGPISTVVFGMVNSPAGSGMGTAGLVGPILALQEMIAAGTAWWVALLEIAGMYFLFPAVICLAVTELFRKLKWIRFGDMKLDL